MSSILSAIVVLFLCSMAGYVSYQIGYRRGLRDGADDPVENFPRSGGGSTPTQRH